MTQVNIFWEGSQFVHHSMAVVNRECCAALSESSEIDLTIVPFEPDIFEPGDDPKLLRLKSLDLRSKGLHPDRLKLHPTVWVRHRGPEIDGRRPPRGAKLIVVFPWEYSRLPLYYLNSLHQADEIWTPSTFSRSRMIDSGLPAEQVHVVPNGVDTQRFSPVGARLALPTSRRFRFLFVGATVHYRKGVDVLLEAYSRAFTGRDDVCLVIKETGAREIYHNKSAQPLIEQYISREDSAEILYLPDYLRETELAQLYRACDVFVSSYRGEGFSLPTLEAMSSGLPVIVPAGGATDDFATTDCSWKIETQPRSIGTTIYNYPLDGEAFVLEPNVEHLVKLMRAAYDNREAVAQKGAAARTQAQRWTWHHAVGKVLQRVDALCAVTTAAHWQYFPSIDGIDTPLP